MMVIAPNTARGLMERDIMKMWVQTNSWIARLAAWKLGVSAVAITMGQTVYLHRSSIDHFLGDPAWVQHELKHVEQFRKYGLFRFLWLYLWASMKHGYYQNPFEVEARAAEQEGQSLAWRREEISHRSCRLVFEMPLNPKLSG